MIDAYGDGLLEKSEFEPRVLAARERLAKLESECQRRAVEAHVHRAGSKGAVATIAPRTRPEHHGIAGDP